MRKSTVLLLAFLLVTLAALPALAGGGTRPTRFGSLDRGLTGVTNTLDGSSWAVWAYRNGAEFDIAVSYDRGNGIWSEPVLIGLDDGMDQVEPAIAFDSRGTLYLVYTQRTTGQIMISHRTMNSTGFAHPTALTPAGMTAGTPVLRIVGERLVIGYNAGRAGLVLLDVPLADERISTNSGFTDGPDPVGTTEKEEEEDDEDDEGSSDAAYPMGGGGPPTTSGGRGRR